MAFSGNISLPDFPGVVFNYHRIDRFEITVSKRVVCFVRHYVDSTYREMEKLDPTAKGFIPRGWLAEGIYTATAENVEALKNLWSEDSPVASTLYKLLKDNAPQFKDCVEA